MGAHLLFSLLRQVPKRNDWLILQYFSYALIALGLLWVSAAIFWYLDVAEEKAWRALASSGIFFVGASIATLFSWRLKKRQEITASVAHFTENTAAMLAPALQKLKGAVKGKGLVNAVLLGLTVAVVYKLAKHK
jgi:hypothetical protein